MYACCTPCHLLFVIALPPSAVVSYAKAAVNAPRHTWSSRATADTVLRHKDSPHTPERKERDHQTSRNPRQAKGAPAPPPQATSCCAGPTTQGLWTAPHTQPQSTVCCCCCGAPTAGVQPTPAPNTALPTLSAAGGISVCLATAKPLHRYQGCSHC